MAKRRRIISLLLTGFFITPLIEVKVIEIPSAEPVKIDCVENSDLRSYAIKQVEDGARVQKQKLERIEREKAEEQARLEEIQRREIEEQKIPVFNPYDVTKQSNLTREQIHSMLEGTSLVTLVDAFYWYEQEYKVNLIFIASIVALESSWGESSLAISHNNLTGYIGGNGEYYSFSSWGESLEETFRLIGDEYTKEEGLFYNGVSVWNINKKYCELDSWSDKVITIGSELFLKIN